jgi:hypothetical protein
VQHRPRGLVRADLKHPVEVHCRDNILGGGVKARDESPLRRTYIRRRERRRAATQSCAIYQCPYTRTRRPSETEP